MYDSNRYFLIDFVCLKQLYYTKLLKKKVIYSFATVNGLFTQIRFNNIYTIIIT